jgi:hypothetical protein
VGGAVQITDPVWLGSVVDRRPIAGHMRGGGGVIDVVLGGYATTEPDI